MLLLQLYLDIFYDCYVMYLLTTPYFFYMNVVLAYISLVIVNDKKQNKIKHIHKCCCEEQ
jgi:hypothetical protein